MRTPKGVLIWLRPRIAIGLGPRSDPRSGRMVLAPRGLVGAEHTAAPVKRPRKASQPNVVLVPPTVQMPPEHDRGDGAGARALERERGATGARARRPRVVDEENRLAAQFADRLIAARIDTPRPAQPRRSKQEPFVAGARLGHNSPTIRRSGWLSSRERSPEGTVVTISKRAAAVASAMHGSWLPRKRESTAASSNCMHRAIASPRRLYAASAIWIASPATL